jgi:hypothetical protein
MITDEIKKEYNPEHKPRFFLHDEMKLWLKEHLNITLINQKNVSSTLIHNKLNIYGLIDKQSTMLSVSIAGEFICTSNIEIDNSKNIEALEKIVNFSEITMSKTLELETKIRELEQRLNSK